MIDIIWTYNKDVHHEEAYKKNLLNYYKRSMFDAHQFGHHTTVYTNDLLFKELDYCDKIEWIDSSDTLFWDEFKRFPLENTDKDFLLVDGDIIFHSFKDGVVYLEMFGACNGCPSSTATLKMGIENMLRHYICLLYTSDAADE